MRGLVVFAVECAIQVFFPTLHTSVLARPYLRQEKLLTGVVGAQFALIGVLPDISQTLVATAHVCQVILSIVARRSWNCGQYVHLHQGAALRNQI